MKGEEKQVKKATEQMGDTVNKDNFESYKEIVNKTVEKAITPKDLLKLSDGQVESIYAQAYRLYNTGRFKDAANLFRLLIMINATEAKYTLGLAACMHMVKDYKAAAEAYYICSSLDPSSPVPLFHASDCYLQIHDKISAVFALEMAIKKAGQRPEYKVLRDRAQLTLDTLKKELVSEGKLKPSATSEK